MHSLITSAFKGTDFFPAGGGRDEEMPETCES